MLKRTKTDALKDNASSAADFAAALAKDKKFRKELVSAVSHGTIARRRAARKIGFLAAATRIASDPKLKREVDKMVKSLDQVWSRVEKKRSHKVRNTLLVLAGAGAAGAAATVPQVRRFVKGKVATTGLPTGGSTPKAIEESIEVDVPVAVAYNQWTQFEDFPLFMKGVDHVEQLDDTTLRWVSTIAGKTNEWTAKIVEQHPDRQITWVSEDGKKTRGTVAFEPVGESKTRLQLSMSYQADVVEAVGSTAGLDSLQVRGDLQRFKELVESRGSETGAWRGEVAAGRKK